MTLTQSEVSALYVSLFGRASEGAGNKYWQDSAKANNWNFATTAQKMLETQASKDFFGNSINSNEAFIAHIYKTTLNKDANSDAQGKAFWVDALNKGLDRGAVVSELLKAALDTKYAQDKDPATKAAHELLVNKIIASNAVADSISDIVLGKDIKEQLKPFIDINNLIGSSSKQEDIRNAINSQKNSLKIDNAKLQKSTELNDKIKILTETLHKSADEIRKELGNNTTPPLPKPDKPKPDEPKPDKPKPDKPNNPNDNDDVKEVEVSLVQKAGGFSARVTKDGKHYFIDIKSVDNADANLQVGDKIILRGEQVFLKNGYKNLKAEIYNIKNPSNNSTKEGLDQDEDVLSVITSNRDKFVVKDQKNGVKAGDFSGAIFNSQDGYVTKNDGKTLIEGTLNGAEATNIKDGDEVSNIYKVVKNGVTTYQIAADANLKKRGFVIDAKPGDIIDFIDNTQSITRNDQPDINAVNKKAFVMKGDSLLIIIYGDVSGERGDDVVIEFKNVNLGKIKVGESAKGTVTGKFILQENILKEGLQKISDKDGFANLLDDNSGITFRTLNNSLYKDALGKYFADARGEQPIDLFDSTGGVFVSQVKFSNGDIYGFESTKKINKSDLNKYNIDYVLNNSQNGDKLITEDKTYVFSGKRKVSGVESKKDYFKFTDDKGDDNITFEQAKTMTKEKFLSGNIYNFVNEDDSLVIDGEVTFTFGQNQMIKKVTEITHSKLLDILSRGIGNKIQDGAIELKSDENIGYQDIKSLVPHKDKLKDESIGNISPLKLEEFLSDDIKNLSAKIKEETISLINENPFTVEQLKSIVNSGNALKLTPYAISKIEPMSIQDAKDLSENLSNKIQSMSMEITKSTAAEIEDFVKKELKHLAVLLEDIKLIKSSDGKEITLTAEEVEYALYILSEDDKIKITDISDKRIAIHKNVDKFTMKQGSTIKITIDEFTQVKAKLEGEGKFEISKVKGNIEASNADETFILANDVLNLSISEFNVDKDKINFSGLKMKAKELNLPAATTNKEIENNKVYEIHLDEVLVAKDFGGNDFTELFGAGKKFNMSAPASNTAVVIVKGTDKTQIYKIAANDDAVFDSNDVSLLGTVTSSNSAVDFTDANIIFG